MKKQSGSDLHQPSQEIPVYISETATPVKILEALGQNIRRNWWE